MFSVTHLAFRVLVVLLCSFTAPMNSGIACISVNSRLFMSFGMPHADASCPVPACETSYRHYVMWGSTHVVMPVPLVGKGWWQWGVACFPSANKECENSFTRTLHSLL